jgi:nucleotide-binding universal stress UspA family protein
MTWIPRKNVVVPIDFSPESIAAIDVALDLAPGASHLRLVHVLPELVPLDPSDASWQTVDGQTRIEQARQALRQRLGDEKYASARMEILVGDAGHCIADYARDEQADLIVMPSHGRTGLARMLIGSVAERVIRLAHCPVLVLRK